MSLSPDLAPAVASSTPPSTVASLLAEAYSEIEALRRELAAVTKRAEKAERLNSSLLAIRPVNSTPNGATTPSPNGPTPLSPNSDASRVLLEYEERANRAEAQRDEAEARRALLADTWSQLSHHLNSCDAAAADARHGFARVVQEGGGSLVLSPPPVLGQHHQHQTRPTRAARSHVFPTLALPPPPHITGSRRPRTPSVDSYSAHPPSKKHRTGGPEFGPDVVRSLIYLISPKILTVCDK